jgi:hypothetical protein
MLGFGHHARQRALYPRRMRHRDHGGLEDVGMGHDHVLQVDARDPLAARLDDVLSAIHDLDIALGGNGSNIAGLEPAVREPVGRFEAIVAAGDPRPPNLYFAHGGAVPGHHIPLLVHKAEVHTHACVGPCTWGPRGNLCGKRSMIDSPEKVAPDKAWHTV